MWMDEEGSSRSSGQRGNWTGFAEQVIEKRYTELKGKLKENLRQRSRSRNGKEWMEKMTLATIIGTDKMDRRHKLVDYDKNLVES